MTFEERFPNLKGLESNPRNLLFSERNRHTKLFNERAINNYCLDKKQVKDSLLKRLNYWENWLNAGRCGDNKIELAKAITAITILKETITGLGL